MLWAAIRAGFEDELVKIAETTLSGLSSETLLNYPQPQKMQSEGFAKAQAILQKAAFYDEVLGTEKTADAVRPDQMPQLRRLTARRRRDSDPPPTKLDRFTSHAGHTLAGTGAAKFVGDAAETGLSALHTRMQRQGKPGFKFMNEKFTEGKLPARHKAAILATGATLGLAHKLRKEHRKKQWEAGHPM